MIEKVIDGVTFYCFEQDEKEARKTFEKSMVGESIIKDMMLALVEANIEMAVRQRDAWEQAKNLLPEQWREDGAELEYSWILRGFRQNSSKATSPPQT